jgi:hypothetical protein
MLACAPEALGVAEAMVTEHLESARDRLIRHLAAPPEEEPG